MSFHIPAHKDVNSPAGQVITDASPAPKDFQRVNHGRVVLLFPRTQAARDWCAEHLPENSATQGSGFAIEPPLCDILWADILDADFVV
jgi:hypothetical protein